MRTASLRASLLTLALFALSPFARADWLVLRDGSQLETKGGWRVSGRQVVFTSADGKLSSLRADLVDQDASVKATAEALRASEEAQAEPAPEAEVKPKSKWSFTDKDFARPEAEDSADDAGGDQDAAKAAPPAAPKSDLDVVVWSQSIDPARNRIKVSGTLQNGGKDMAASIELEVQLVDRQGVIVGAQAAVIQKLSLAPGESTDFSTTFPQIVGYEKVNFAPKATMFKVEPKDDKGKPAAPAAPQ